MTPQLASDIKKMEKAGRLAAETLNYIEKYIKPGITTNEINNLVHDFTLSNDAVPAPLGYKGFPKSVCTSVNDCICHGVPDETILKEGDTINVDVTCIKEEFHGDTSRTFFVGEVSEKAKEVTRVAYEAMHKGIEAITPNGKTGDIGFVINKYVTRQGYYAVKEIGGHGIGRVFHMEPFIPSYGKKGKGQPLKPWHCITVEPMVNENSPGIKEFKIPNSDITYYHTVDGSLSAQFEHTILITDTGYQILTVAD